MPKKSKSEEVEVIESNNTEVPSVAEAKPKNAKLASLLKKIAAAGNETFGEGTIFLGGDGPQMDVEAVSTGSLGLDNAIGVGGLPKGRIIEIFGPEASGKTMVSLSTIAEVQKAGGIAAFIDAEHALTPDWCRSLGVDFDNLLLSQPESGEKALSIMKYLVEQGDIDVIVLDSVAALVTQREIDGDMDANHMGLTARLMSLALKKLTPIVSKSKTCCIFINQVRENLGVMFGNKETTPGGKALKFYSSVRLRASKTSSGQIMSKTNKNEQIGHNVTVKVVKNKVAPPFKETKFDLYYLGGIDQNSEIVGLAFAKGIVTKEKNTIIYGDKTWVGMKNFETSIRSDKALSLEIKNKVQKALHDRVPDVAAAITVKEKDGILYDVATGEILDEVVNDEKEL